MFKNFFVDQFIENNIIVLKIALFLNTACISHTHLKLQILNLPNLSIILQNIIATNVLTIVATIAGPTIAAGFTLPY